MKNFYKKIYQSIKIRQTSKPNGHHLFVCVFLEMEGIKHSPYHFYTEYIPGK